MLSHIFYPDYYPDALLITMAAALIALILFTLYCRRQCTDGKLYESWMVNVTSVILAILGISGTIYAAYYL